ncbi:ArnT family glycosyltransferase [Kineococcus rhizosphaerae]|uniref:4-amino-4-deoxy-L-arabinose transferase-like glycosyltransferase n=1 Tax=Kineococcus rhizosphaerae TaxID=559628 RepID=A0A2T0R9S8_9ACTN|nr:glycosyltransferase family 39 protein [Kineococcus rhizosphaerae]PRY17890.1 4-amino-4-deoxy-L-arabinose transferase-like glycosyltransferase [Kineococcus rhizosphaerae]
MTTTSGGWERTATVPATARARRLARTAWRGREQDPRWVRPALFGLLVATAVLYLVGLSVSGWANPFYSAAAQAGSRSWEAWFFGSSDASNAITVDKPPAALWVTGLSVRLFGLSSWSILVPQALEGVATVGLLYATVRRRSTPAAGLVAGFLLATTPVATLMFRFNNPDALLVLLMVASVWGVVKAVDTGRARFLYWAGVFVGLGFLTKQLQVFLVLPGLGLAYLWAAPHGLGKRVRHLLVAAATMVVAGGWWVAVVELVPDSWRPYVGGSQDNSFLELTFGYNGFGRLTGDETGSVGATNGWGETGIGRMFNAEFGGNISWLLPAAFVLAVAGFVVTRRARRTDGRRAGYLVWAGWLVVTFTAFSFMSGIIHPYYSVALAPAVAALVAMGAVDLWRLRASRVALPVLAVVVALSTAWSFVLLGRSSDFLPWLRWVVLVAGVMGTAGLTAAGFVRGPLLRSLQQAGVVAAAIAVLAGPLAYSVQTASTAHTGAIVSAGPSSSGGFSMGGGRAGGGGGGQFSQLFTQGRLPSAPAGGGTTTGQAPTGGTGTFGGGTRSRGFGGGGGLLGSTTPSAELQALLEADADDYRWVAATTGSNNAAGYQLATQEPVMAVGGFNGTDPAPTLAQFQQYVADGEIHYYVASASMASTASGGSDVSGEIAQWVEENFTATTVGGTTVYDLTAGSGTTTS